MPMRQACRVVLLRAAAPDVLVLALLEGPMIPYVGLPITPETAAYAAVNAGHPFISFRYRGQLALALAVAQSFAVDNAAFSAWKSGNPITNWQPYYEWVAELMRYPQFDFAVIPDVIDGDEEANDALVAEWPWRDSAKHKSVGAPVWHMHESIDRLVRLATEWPRICIGSSGEYATVGNAKWWNRIAEAMNAICDENGSPICKIHGLRMLNPDVFSRLPFSSADSTNIAQNIGIDSAWRGTYQPKTKECRALLMRDNVERTPAATYWKTQAVQMDLAA